MNRVLVLDASQRSALAVTRSLGAKGVHVITADDTNSTLAGSSRYAHQHIVTPSPRHKPFDFISKIAEICRKLEISIILPMTELTTALVTTHRDSLPKVILPFPEPQTLSTLSDKCVLMRLAKSMMIPAPRTFFLDTNIDIQIPDEFTYPIVLKPGKSWLEHDGKWLHTNVRFAASRSDAMHIIATDPAFHASPYMLQEYLPGSGAGVFAIYDHGKPLAFFAHKRIREKPPSGGVSVLSESRDVDPRLKSYALKLLNHVGWHGVAMVEFRISTDGNPYLMEVNTRFWGSLQLAIDSGVDFPWLLFQLACGNEVDRIESYRTGQRLRWLLGDIDSLYLLLRDPGFSNAEKFHAVFDFMKPSPFRTRHEVNRLDDMGPFWWELKQYIRDLIK